MYALQHKRPHYCNNHCELMAELEGAPVCNDFEVTTLCKGTYKHCQYIAEEAFGDSSEVDWWILPLGATFLPEPCELCERATWGGAPRCTTHEPTLNVWDSPATNGDTIREWN